ncbi:hypothetical protein ACFYN0_04795 [Streptomyces sp. NPDC006704]|uniref:hypothetical protein n=1 Tax=Streptomyces sp. NPDC006704 TaxID=3364760 RepID=UPI0036B0F4B4
MHHRASDARALARVGQVRYTVEGQPGQRYVTEAEVGNTCTIFGIIHFGETFGEEVEVSVEEDFSEAVVLRLPVAEDSRRE